MKRKFLMATVLVSLCGFGAPMPAQAGILEFFFPMLKKQEPDPSKTLEAPFAEKKEGPQQPIAPGAPAAAAKPLPENSVAMDKPHRSTQQIGAWIGPVVSEAMSFVGADAKADLAATEKYFDKGGREQYLKFLSEQKISQVLNLNKYTVRSYVRDVPLLLNEGAAEGKYHWLYEIPVMVSYLDRSVTDYKKADAVNQLFVLKVQVGRSAETVDPTGVVIEHWNGKSVKLDKK